MLPLSQVDFQCCLALRICGRTFCCVFFLLLQLSYTIHWPTRRLTFYVSWLQFRPVCQLSVCSVRYYRDVCSTVNFEIGIFPVYSQINSPWWFTFFCGFQRPQVELVVIQTSIFCFRYLMYFNCLISAHFRQMSPLVAHVANFFIYWTFAPRMMYIPASTTFFRP